MDKYIVLKRLSNSPEKSQSSKIRKRSVQASLFELPGVTVSKDLDSASQRLKECLNNDDESVQKQLKVLSTLESKDPGPKLLSKSDIDIVLRDLKNITTDLNVRNRTKKLLKRWKKYSQSKDTIDEAETLKVAKPKKFHTKVARRQSSLKELAGVVVKEDVIAAKEILSRRDYELDDDLTHLQIQTINRLSLKKPATEIIIETKIGKIVKKLSEESSISEVKDSALNLYQLWSDMISRRIDLKSNKIEVKCDSLTEEMREKSKEFMLKNFIEEKEGSKKMVSCIKERKLTEKLEKEIFRFCDSKSTNKYRRISRKVIFELKDSKIRERLLKDPSSIKKYISSLV